MRDGLELGGCRFARSTGRRLPKNAWVYKAQGKMAFCARRLAIFALALDVNGRSSSSCPAVTRFKLIQLHAQYSCRHVRCIRSPTRTYLSSRTRGPVVGIHMRWLATVVWRLSEKTCPISCVVGGDCVGSNPHVATAVATHHAFSAKFAAADRIIATVHLGSLSRCSIWQWCSQFISSCPTSCGDAYVRAHVSSDRDSWARDRSTRAVACGRAAVLRRATPSSTSCNGVGPPRTSPIKACRRR